MSLKYLVNQALEREHAREHSVNTEENCQNEREHPVNTAREQVNRYQIDYLEDVQSVKSARDSIDTHWLIETHPSLWLKIVEIDGELSNLEAQCAEVHVYQRTLNLLTTVVHTAHELYVYDREHQQVIRQ